MAVDLGFGRRATRTGRPRLSLRALAILPLDEEVDDDDESLIACDPIGS